MAENALFPEIARNQRVVVHHQTGPYKGLFQIIGHTDETGGQVPPLVDDFKMTVGTKLNIREFPIGLIASKTRFVLYREITNPTGLGRFDPRQK